MKNCVLVVLRMNMVILPLIKHIGFGDITSLDGKDLKLTS